MTTEESKWVVGIVEGLIRIRWVMLVAITACVGLSLYWAPKVVFDGSVEVWFLEDDEDIQTYNHFRQKFGQDEFIVVGLFGDHLFESQTLGALHRFTERVESLDRVESARSITNVEILRQVDSDVAMLPVSDEIPDDPHSSREFREDVLDNPMLSPGLASEDGTATCVVVTLTRDTRDVDSQSEVLRKIQELSNEIFGPLESPPRVRMAGTPVVNVGMFEFARKDLLTTIPIAMGLVIITSLVLFRHWMAPIVPLAVVGIASVWVVGGMGAYGLKATILSSPLLLLILVVGVADSIHLLSSYQHELRQGKEIRVAMRDGLAHVFVPCLFTSLTTIGGFLSLMVSELKPIKEFGLMSALGVAFAFFLSFAFVPVLLPWVKGSGRVSSSVVGGQAAPGVVDRLLIWLGRPGRNWCYCVLIVTVLTAIPAGAGIGLIETSTNPMNYFREGSAIREDTLAIDQQLGGSSSFEFLVTAEDEGLLDYDNLVRLDNFERWMEDEIGVSRCISIVDVLKEYERVRKGANRGEETLPHPRRAALLVRRLRKHAPQQFDKYVQDEFETSRVTARVNLTDADALNRQVDPVIRRIESEFSSATLKLEPTGFIKLIANMQDYVVSSQINSFVAAAIVISIMLLLLLRSWLLGLVAMISNFLPILLGLGLMGWLDIKLDTGTVMIATVAIGLVVDDTCHFLVRYRNARKQHGVRDSISSTMISAGRPIVLTSLILIAGFCSLGLGSFYPTVYFGLITAAIIFFAVVVDLLAIPALLLIAAKDE